MLMTIRWDSVQATCLRIGAETTAIARMHLRRRSGNCTIGRVR